MLIDLCLMHKDVKVIYFTADITDLYCYITDVGSVLSPINCPEFILNTKDKKLAIRTWWKLRCMPETRRDFTNIITMLYNGSLLSKHQVNDSIFLVSLLSYAQNIKDHYWINPAMEYKVTYPNISSKMKQYLKPAVFDDINFYKNIPQNDDVRNLVLDCHKKDYSIENYLSPNICIHGDKIKFWEYNQEEEAYYLHKYLHGIAEIEQNEFKVYEFIKKENPNLATKPIVIRKNLNDYDLSEGRDVFKKYIAYKNFITENTELITGDEILLAQGPQKGDPYEIFLENCQYLSIPIKFVNEVVYMSDELDKYFDMDVEIEYDNIGFIRDCKTKQFIKPAPIFGNSYFQNIL